MNERCDHCDKPADEWLCEPCHLRWLRAVDLRNAESDREYSRLWDKWEKRLKRSAAR